MHFNRTRTPSNLVIGRWLCVIALFWATTTWAAGPSAIGPFGGSAAFVQVDRGAVVAATSNSLLFRSTDGGDNWTSLPFPAALRSILHAFVITNSGIYLAGLEDQNKAYSGVLRSTDEGRTWAALAGLGSRDVWSIAVFPTNSRIIAVGASDGVFLSRDAGDHWDRISPESNEALKPIVSLAFDPLDSGILYAGTPHLPWKTRDGGKTWAPSNRGMDNDSDVFSIIVAEPFRDVFASACSGIYRSVDRGAHWTRLPVAQLASFRTYQIAQHPRLRKVLFAATAQGLVKSTDAGATWRRVSAESTHSIAFDLRGDNRVFVATDDAGLFRSDDLGESFKPVNYGFSNRRVLSIALWHDAVYASTAITSIGGGMYRLTIPGGSWEDLAMRNPELPKDPVLKLVPSDRGLFAVTAKCVMFSGDEGRAWEKQCLPPTASKLTDIVVAAAGDRFRITVSAEDAIYFTNVGAEGWNSAALPELDGAIRSLVSLGEGVVAAMTASSLLVSNDGATYKAATPAGAYGGLYALVASESGALLLATSRGLRRSDDSGRNWRAVAGELDGRTVYSICAHPAERGVMFASHYGVIYRSEDDGRSWSRFSGDTPEIPPVKQLMVAPGSPARLLLLTHNQGLFSIPLEHPSRQLDSERHKTEERIEPH